MTATRTGLSIYRHFLHWSWRTIRAILNFLILFESIGMMGLVLNQYGGNYWVYETDWAKGMMLERLFGSPEYLITLKVFNSYTKMDYLSPVFLPYLLYA